MSGRGRPKGWRKEFSEMRPQRQLRAFDDEWILIKNFMQIVRKIGVEKSEKIIDNLKNEYQLP